jgi:hypothetical protein
MANPAPFLRNQLIAIRCDNGRLWTVVNMGGITGKPACFHTDTTQVYNWQKFNAEVVDAANLKFALKTTSGFYICAENGGNVSHPDSPVQTTATNLNEWERLIVEYQPDGTFAIKTLNGFYLTCMDNGGRAYDGQPFSSNRTHRAAWEIFSAIPLEVFKSVRISFRTSRNFFLTAVNNGGLKNSELAMSTGATTVGPNEKFYVEIVDLGQDKFALRTLSGFFITFENGGGIGGPNDASCPIHTDATKVGGWEQFVAVRQLDGTYAFRTATGGFYLTAVNGGGRKPAGTPPVSSIATTRGTNEIFTAIYY